MQVSLINPMSCFPTLICEYTTSDLVRSFAIRYNPYFGTNTQPAIRSDPTNAKKSNRSIHIWGIQKFNCEVLQMKTIRVEKVFLTSLDRCAWTTSIYFYSRALFSLTVNVRMLCQMPLRLLAPIRIKIHSNNMTNLQKKKLLNLLELWLIMRT